jgi:hypothetical protein
MKRSLVVKLLANEIRNQNTGHYSYNETLHANEVLKFMEQLGIVKPTRKVTVTRRDIELMPYEDTIEVTGWEEE